MKPKAPFTEGAVLSEREIIAILDAYAQSAISTRSSKLSSDRAKALRYYNMEPYGDETKTGSKMVTSEVFDTVETVATRLVKVFTSTDKAVEFVPEGPEDVDAADQKTKYCNHIFYRKNNGFLTLYECIKDGLLMKNGIIKVYPEVNKSVQFSRYEGLTLEQAVILAEDEGTEFVEADWRQEQDGTVLYDIGVKHVNEDVKICVESVPPEDIKVCGWHKSVLLENADYIEHRSRLSVSKLREMDLIGPDEDVTELGGAGFDEDDSSDEELARDDEIEEQRSFRESNPLQKDMWRIVVRDIVARVDEDGDGIAERRRIIRIGNSIRYDEPTDYCGYGVFAPILMPHRYVGKSYADLEIQHQRMQSTLERQKLNNIYLNNHQRPIVLMSGNVPQADVGSLMESGPGHPIFEKHPNAIRYEPPQPIVQDIIAVSEEARQHAEKRTGVTRLTSRGINPDVITKTATGAAIVAENENEREELLCRVFAETCLQPVFAAIAHLTRTRQNRKEMIRIYKKFVEIDPSTWSETYDMTINVGLGSGTARQTTDNLMQVAGLLEKLIAGGGLGTLVLPENLYNLSSRVIESVGFKDPSPFINDPSTIEPKPPEPSIEEKQLETLERIEQAKTLLKKLEIETQSEDAARKNDVDMIRAALDARARIMIANRDANLKALQVEVDVIKADRKNRTDTEIAVMNAVRDIDTEELRAKSALELEDKKVISLKRARKAKAAPKEREKRIVVPGGQA